MSALDQDAVGRPTDEERTRTGLSKDALKRAFTDNLFYVQGRFPEVATDNDNYMTKVNTVRDRLRIGRAQLRELVLKDPLLKSFGEGGVG